MMTDLAEIQTRFETALKVLQNAGATAGNSDEIEGLKARVAELEAENAKLRQDLSAQVTAKRKAKRANVAAQGALEKATTRINELETDLAAKAESEAKIADFSKREAVLIKAKEMAEAETAKALQFNKHLQDVNEDLLNSSKEKVADPELINQAMQKELEQVKAQRLADLGEINTILERLTPLVEGH